MLGKTNILATKESSIITDIEEFHWKAVNISSKGLEKAVYSENTGTLVVIASGGTVLWSSDGEIWESKSFENTILKDVIWDGSRYVFVGYYVEDNKSSGIIVTSEDLVTFNQIVEESTFNRWYLGICYKDGEYIIVGVSGTLAGATGGKMYAYKYTGNLDSCTTNSINAPDDNATTIGIYTQVCMAKSADGCLLRVKTYDSRSTGSFYAFVNITQSGTNFTQLESLHKSNDYQDTDQYYVYECKGELYYSETADTYRIKKITNMASAVIVSDGKNFLFRTAVYFNNSCVFFNNHEMLVLRKNEMLADKEMEDLVEVSYEHSISQAVKAWGKIVLLCENGNILVSSAETEDPGAVVVKTLSAKKALHEAKVYTDARMDEIMDGVSLSITEEGNLVARKGDRVFQISATEI